MSKMIIPRQKRVGLRDGIDRHFDDEELCTLCFDIGVDYEELKGRTRAARARDLVLYVERHGLVSALIGRCAELRPHVDWAEFLPDEIEEEPFSPPIGELHQRISDAALAQPGCTNWQFLEQVVVRAVVMGGVAAMMLYRQTMPSLSELVDLEKEKNPSTEADLQATARILETVNALLPPVTLPNLWNCRLSYLGEETRFINWFRRHVRGNIPERVLSAQAFFSRFCEYKRLRVIVDGIDGTGSFTRGLPLFCSAAAILVEDEPRVSAIYDPIHHTVYSAVLMGPHGRPESKAAAWAWQVATGNRVNLIESGERELATLRQEALGIHLTRTHRDKLHEFFQPAADSGQCQLERLAQAAGATYALNSGIVAMSDIATGALGGLVNNITNLWDIAAGEVLVRACGGKVTDFEGRPIQYSMDYRPSLVAAKGHLHQEILDILAGRTAA